MRAEARRELAVMACLAALLACGSKSAPQASDAPPSSNRRGPPPVVIQPPQAPTAPTAPTAPPTRSPPAPMLPGGILQPSTQTVQKPARDLGAELANALGSPASCMKPRPPGGGPSTIVVSLEAVVTENGIVTRGAARSGELDAEELECLRKRIASLHLPGPIELAPRTVTASVTLNRQVLPAAPANPSAQVPPTGPGAAPAEAAPNPPAPPEGARPGSTAPTAEPAPGGYR